jgi:hypothetical protein
VAVVVTLDSDLGILGAPLALGGLRGRKVVNSIP